MIDFNLITLKFKEINRTIGYAAYKRTDKSRFIECIAMKNTYRTLCLLALLIPLRTAGQITHQIDFTIKNLGFNVAGEFKSSSVSGNIDLQNPSQTKLSAILVVSTIDTDNDSRDEHLLAAEYFDASSFPNIEFDSLSFTPKDGDNYTLTGNLKIKGTTKKVSIPLAYTAQNRGGILKGSLTINRRDFGVGGRSMILSSKVLISFELQIPQS